MSTANTEAAHDDLYAVTGVGGAQGGAIARALTRRGLRVRGVTRSNKAPDIAIEGVAADLGKLDQIRAAFEGVTHVALTIPLCYDADLVGLYVRNVTQAAGEAGVRRIVLNTNTRIPGEITTAVGFETRRLAEDLVFANGAEAVALRPAMYLENLTAPWVSAGVVDDGVLRYPVPTETTVGWLSHHDLGEAVAAAFATASVVGRTIDIGGDGLNGHQIAAIMGAASSLAVEYEPMDPADFEAALAEVLGADAAHGVAGLYHWVGSNLDTKVMAGGVDGLRELGVEPTPPQEWATTHARWLRPATAN